MNPKSCACAVMLLFASGCSHGVMLLESDVPLPEGMTTVQSADIRRSAGTVTGGKFLLTGEVNDAATLLRETITRYEAAGWTVVNRVVGLDHSEAVFAKDARRVQLTIDRRALDPAMSAGMLEVSTTTTG
jgi:hypothetical protein